MRSFGTPSGHTFASRLVISGVNLKTVQELMGPETIAMTARQAHLAPTQKLQARRSWFAQGSVSGKSGCKLAANAIGAARISKTE
jgi:hypothetical protein